MTDEPAHESDPLGLLNSTGIAVLFLDAALRVRRYTPAFGELAGVAVGAGQPLAALAGNFDDPHLDPDGRAVLGGAVPAEREIEVGGRHFLRRALPHRAAGRTAGVVVTLVDITERKRAEAALRVSEERFRNVLDGMDEAFGFMDRELRIITQNRTALRLDGRPLEAIRGRTHAEVYPDAAPELLRLYDRALAEGVPVSLEHRYAWPGGLAAWLEMRAYPVPDGLAVFWRDITSRKAAEQALRESEAKYRTLFESIDEGFCIIEMLYDGGRPVDYRFLEANPAFEQHTGLSGAVGRTARELVPELDTGWFETYGRVAATGEAVRFQQASAAMDRWFDVYAFRTGAPEGRRVAVLFTDITARKRAEARQAFLLKLSDALRAEPGADAVATRALRMLSEQLRLDRCYVWVYRLADDRADLTHQVGNDRVPPLPDRIRLSDFPDALRVATDRTLVIDDVAAADLSDTDRRNIDALGLRALVAAGLREGEGNLLWTIVAVSATPRGWTRDEVALVEEVAERTWAAVERARAEAELRASEAQYRAIAANLPSGAVFVIGPDLRYRLADGEAFRAAGFVAADVEGKTVAEAVGPGLTAEYESNYRRALAGETFRAEHAAHDRHFVTHGAPLRAADGRVTAALVVSYDITDRKRAENELQAIRAQLEARVTERTAELASALESLEAEMARRTDLARRLATAQEDERRRVARDLHDTLGQTLTALSLAAAAGRAEQVRELADSLARELHEVAVRLRPTALDDTGLAVAAQALTEEWARRTGVPVEFQAVGLNAGRLPAEVETTLFRAIQEALTNAAKHAGATRVSVVVGRRDDEAVAVVEDDGVGFDPDVAVTPPPGRPGGLGLVGMRERVAVAGGAVEVEAAPGRGTTVIARIPLRPRP